MFCAELSDSVAFNFWDPDILSGFNGAEVTA